MAKPTGTTPTLSGSKKVKAYRNPKKPKRGRAVRAFAAAVLLGTAAGGVYFDQYLDPHEQQSLIDAVNPIDELSPERRNLTVEEKREIAEYIPEDYEILRDRVLGDAQASATILSSFVDEASDGVITKYETERQILDNLPDLGSIHIQMLRDSNAGEAAEYALELLDGDLLGPDSELSQREIVTIQAAIFLSLSMVDDDRAAEAFEALVFNTDIDDGYVAYQDGVATSAASILSETGAVEGLHTVIYSRNRFLNEEMAGGQLKKRGDLYNGIAAAVLRSFDQNPVPVAIAMSEDTGMGRAAAFAAGNLTSSGEEYIIVHYDDRTVGPESWVPRAFRDDVAQTDWLSDDYIPFLAIGHEAEHIATQRMVESLINGTIDPDHPTYTHAVISMVNFMNYARHGETEHDHEADERYRSQYIERTAYRFGEVFGSTYKTLREAPEPDVAEVTEEAPVRDGGGPPTPGG